MKLSFLILAPLLCLNQVSAEQIRWEPWSDSVFSQAAQQGRFVLLDLGTGWCHWCHVMEEVTYSDPAVIELIGKRYLAVRVDADARPDQPGMAWARVPFELCLSDPRGVRGFECEPARERFEPSDIAPRNGASMVGRPGRVAHLPGSVDVRGFSQLLRAHDDGGRETR